MTKSNRTRIFILISVFIAGSVNAQYSSTPQPKPPWAPLLGFNANATSTPEWVSLAKLGLELRNAGKLEESVTPFQSASTKLKVQESASDPLVIQYGVTRMDMLIGYGDVLNRLNRPDEALPLLEQAAALEKDELDTRAKRATTSTSYLDAMAALQATMSNAMNMARQLRRKFMIVESDTSIPFEESLAEQLPDTLLTSLFLADSYSRKGDRIEVLKLYDNQFQDYLRRQRENNNPSARFNLDMAVEASCLRFALVLARMGPSPQQDQSFNCALDLNLANQRTIGTGAKVASAQEGMASQRRLFVGAYADQVTHTGAADLPTQRRLVELIADSKGLSTRYAQRIRQLPDGHPNSPACGHLKFPHPERGEMTG
jgi:tetratricopeptide (TPR) repeat protein